MMYDFNVNDLKNVEKYTKTKLIFVYTYHLIFEIIAIVTSMIISMQFIEGTWQPIAVAIGLSLWPSIKIFDSLMKRQLELSKIYNYIKNNGSEILKTFNSMKDEEEQEKE